MHRGIKASGVALVLALSVSGTARAGFVESFEGFEGASGSSVAGYAGDDGSGTWTLGSGAQAFVVVDDGTAFDGQNYLRINDNSGGQHHVYKEFAELVPVPEEGVRIRFALRRTPQPGVDAVTGVNFGTKITAATEPGNTGTEFPNTNMFTSSQAGAENMGVWFLYEMTAIVNGNLQAQLVDFTITDTTSGEVVFTDDVFSSSVSLTEDHDQLSWLRFFSHGSSQGMVDIDGISYAAVPEPASLALAGVASLAMLARRRGNRH